ncbi:MAG: hypothetical protein AAGD25_21905 [Cyanobacteria bacterium P01_F01_bin.150]
MSISTSDFSKIGQQVVEHNGFRFWFNAYDNCDLRHLQFFFIESELRQAVGRARVNTEMAHVLLLSNYPLSEACVSDEEITQRRQRLEKSRQKQLEHLEACFDASPNLETC